MTKLVTFVFAGALAASAATYTGVITDAMCGRDHSAMNVKPDAKCVRECVKMGSKYALYDGKDVYTLSGDQAALDKYAGEKVKVNGTLDAKAKTLKVDSIQPAGK